MPAMTARVAPIAVGVASFSGASSRQYPAEWNDEQGIFEISIVDKAESSSSRESDDDNIPLLQAIGSGGVLKRRDRHK